MNFRANTERQIDFAPSVFSFGPVYSFKTHFHEQRIYIHIGLCYTNQCGFVSFIDDEETWSYLIYHNIIFVIFSAKQNNEVLKAIFAGNLFNLKM